MLKESAQPDPSCLFEAQQLPLRDEPTARRDRPETHLRPTDHDFEETEGANLIIPTSLPINRKTSHRGSQYPRSSDRSVPGFA